MPLPAGWEWDGHWAVASADPDVTAVPDSQGWVYGQIWPDLDFPFQPSDSAGSGTAAVHLRDGDEGRAVRRRRWVRRRLQTAAAAASEAAAAAAAALDPLV